MHTAVRDEESSADIQILISALQGEHELALSEYTLCVALTKEAGDAAQKGQIELEALNRAAAERDQAAAARALGKEKQRRCAELVRLRSFAHVSHFPLPVLDWQLLRRRPQPRIAKQWQSCVAR